jgi:hypothetical protein
MVTGVWTILSLETETVLVNGNHTGLKCMPLEGLRNKKSKPKDRIMTLALNLSSVLSVEWLLMHRLQLPPDVCAAKWEEKKTEVKESSRSVAEPAEGSLM